MLIKNLIVMNLIHYFVNKIFLMIEIYSNQLIVNHWMINQVVLNILNYFL